MGGGTIENFTPDRNVMRAFRNHNTESADDDYLNGRDSFNLSEASEVKINKDIVCYMADEK